MKRERGTFFLLQKQNKTKEKERTTFNICLHFHANMQSTTQWINAGLFDKVRLCMNDNIIVKIIWKNINHCFWLVICYLINLFVDNSEFYFIALESISTYKTSCTRFIKYIPQKYALRSGKLIWNENIINVGKINRLKSLNDR